VGVSGRAAVHAPERSSRRSPTADLKRLDIFRMSGRAVLRITFVEWFSNTAPTRAAVWPRGRAGTPLTVRFFWLERFSKVGVRAGSAQAITGAIDLAWYTRNGDSLAALADAARVPEHTLRDIARRLNEDARIRLAWALCRNDSESEPDRVDRSLRRMPAPMAPTAK
jgi:hypothetical protein